MKIPTTEEIRQEIRAREARFLVATIDNMSRHRKRCMSILCARVREAIIKEGYGERAARRFAAIRDATTSGGIDSHYAVPPPVPRSLIWRDIK